MSFPSVGINYVILVSTAPFDGSYMFKGCQELKKITFISGTANDDLSSMFRSCSNLEIVDFGDNFDTTKTTCLNSAFAECPNLKTVIFGSKFKTTSVTSFNQMFDQDTALEYVDMSGFSFSAVPNDNALKMAFNDTLTNTVLLIPKSTTDRFTAQNTVFAGNECLESKGFTYSENSTCTECTGKTEYKLGNLCYTEKPPECTFTIGNKCFTDCPSGFTADSENGTCTCSGGLYNYADITFQCYEACGKEEAKSLTGVCEVCPMGKEKSVIGTSCLESAVVDKITFELGGFVNGVYYFKMSGLPKGSGLSSLIGSIVPILISFNFESSFLPITATCTYQSKENKHLCTFPIGSTVAINQTLH